MEDAKQAYHAFNALWGKVPRHVRVDRDNHQRMLEVRAYFDGILEAAKRAAIVNAALAVPNPNGASQEGVEEEPEPNATPVHLALRLLRTLGHREWEMVKAIVDLHKFSTEDFLDVLDEIQDTHCPRCGEWLDDDDAHENCPVPEEDDDEVSSHPPVAAPAVAVATQPSVEAGVVQVVAVTPEEAHVPVVLPKPNE